MTDYLIFDRVFRVHHDDIFYIRRPRYCEVVETEGELHVYEPLDRDKAVIVFQGHKPRRYVTEMRLDDLVRGGMAFVDVGAGRYVPAANIREICASPEGSAFEGTEVWLHGRPYGICLMSEVKVSVLERRWEDALARQPEAPVPGGAAVRLAAPGKAKELYGSTPLRKAA